LTLDSSIVPPYDPLEEGPVDEWNDPTDAEFLRGMRAVFDATWREAMGRRWPALAADVEALCERALAVGFARGERSALDMLRVGGSLAELGGDDGGRRGRAS
jgi:hypothetical protein